MESAERWGGAGRGVAPSAGRTLGRQVKRNPRADAHSGKAKEIIGATKVIKEWYLREDSDGGTSDLDAVGKIQTPVIKEKPKEEAGKFDGLLLKQPRLSVMPIPSCTWVRISKFDGF
ncbi:hypothetical protein EJ110_NYTH03886 [Nymphaea thermarum]|nr:hypothetical protein EJ110_NYTH03886 [Nymphaea thermarum]